MQFRCAWQSNQQDDCSSQNDDDYLSVLDSDIASLWVFCTFHPVVDSMSKQTRRKPDNLDSMLDVAQKMARATGKRFQYGLAYYLNDYPADGTIFDYMAGVRKVK